MKLIMAGKCDELDEFDIEKLPHDIEWFLYSYANGGYDGRGIGLAKMDDGTFKHWDLGHCSCYGPCENGADGDLADDAAVMNWLDNEAIAAPGETRVRNIHDYDYCHYVDMKAAYLALKAEEQGN